MIPGLSSANVQFVTDVDNLQTQLNNTQNQLATGLRVNKADRRIPRCRSKSSRGHVPKAQPPPLSIRLGPA